MIWASTATNEHPANSKPIRSLRCLLRAKRMLLGITANKSITASKKPALIVKPNADQQSFPSATIKPQTTVRTTAAATVKQDTQKTSFEAMAPVSIAQAATNQRVRRQPVCTEYREHDIHRARAML
jgi:hypothetical protein